MRRLLHNKKFLTVVALVAICLLIPHITHAESSIFLEGARAIIGWVVKEVVALLGKIALQLVYILVAVASYNEFVNSPAVAEGWAIVRDVVNMFFIVVLLVIAFATIFNVKEYKYQAMLPRLLIMAVVINFSRTICGIFIDLGQVVMLTFVNGFQAAAGGNFVNALKITELMTFDQSQLDKSTLLSYAQIFAAMLLALIMMIVTVIVLAVMVLVLVMRIIMLWFLIILSPLAFMASVWPSGRLKQKYGQWWDMFLDNIMVGPILAFFLWLSLLVLGTGDYGTTIIKEYTDEGGTGQATSEQIMPNTTLTQIGTPQNMLSYLMGISMLLGSLYMASQMRSAGSGIAGAALGKVKGYASAGVRKAAALPIRGAKWTVKKSAGALYEKTGMRANLGVLKSTIQKSRVGRAVGLGTKEYKDLGKAKRDEKALRNFGKTADADALRNRILATETKKLDESGITSGEVTARLNSGKLKKGSYEQETLARVAAKRGDIKTSRDFKKYAGDDRRMEEALRKQSFQAGNKEAMRGWVDDPKKQINEQKEAEANYYGKTIAQREAMFTNFEQKAEEDDESRVSGEFAAADASVIAKEDFNRFSEKIQEGILNGILLLQKSDPQKFTELHLEDKFNELVSISRRGSADTRANFTAYSASPEAIEVHNNAAKSVAKKRLDAERAGTLVRSDVSKAAVQIFKAVVGQEGAGTGLDQGREWQKNTLERTYDIENNVSVMQTPTDALDIATQLTALQTRLENKAGDMDTAGVRTGQIDVATGNEMSNVEAFLNSDLQKNMESAKNLANTGATDNKTKEAMQSLLNVVARDMETVAPRTGTMSNRAKTRIAVGRYTESRGRASRAIDNAKNETKTEIREKAVQLAMKKAKDTIAIVQNNKKQYSERILNEASAILREIDNILKKGASADNGDLSDIDKRLEDLEKKKA